MNPVLSLSVIFGVFCFFNNLIILSECRYGASNKVILPIIQPFSCFSHYPGNSELAMVDLNNDPTILQNYEISYNKYDNCGNDARPTVNQLIRVMNDRTH